MTNISTRFQIRERQPVSGRTLPSPMSEPMQKNLERAQALLAEEFLGVTTDGRVVPGLYQLQKTGLSIDPIKNAANAFLSSLNPVQKATASFEVDDIAWRQWSNIHPFLMRHGAFLDELSPAQRDNAMAMLKESLSPKGYQTARDIMRLNESILEITGKTDEYGEWLYWMSMMGTPSSDEPWGWQIDGHHLIVNCFMVNGQAVMTPMFMGSEPVDADAGKYAGTRVFHDEEHLGLVLAQSLSAEQRSKAVISDELNGEVFTTAFRDNFELKYEGIPYSDLSSSQQGLMVSVIDTYVGRIRSDHAALRMDEVKRHLGETYFAWMGASDDDSVFYYRIHSPVILIEFDHQRGVALEADKPTRDHIHTVVRTPNGNDYGKDLLRQHRENADASHGHRS
jgi:hypothetical protein